MADDDQREDRPDKEPAQRSAVDSKADEKRESKKQLAERQRREWLQRQLADPHGRQFLWDILAAAGTFEKRYGFGPNGDVNPDATQFFDGQRDLGLRLYHSWSQVDRAGVLSLLDEFHPLFPRKGK